MAKLSEWVVKQQRLVNRDRLLGDDGELFLQMPSNGTKTWVIGIHEDFLELICVTG